MQVNEKNIFLVDGTGALLTAAIVGLAFPAFAPRIGVSVGILQVLGLFALACALFSWACHFETQRTRPWMLLAILLANAAYCALTAYLCAGSPGLTRLGRAYFSVEIAILFELTLMELKLYRALRATVFLRGP